ncbi:MAG: DUF1844 domain-containing protein [Acidobacteriota bacterium]|nr:DUF1844 domain-containing protein [Acidobacteriota bacterium]
MNDTDFPLPPATFEFLIASLKMQAEVQLGLLHFGEEKDRPAPNLPVARHSIDMLSMLQEKTRGNLSMEEQRMIENSVTELRFRYIHVFEQNKQAAAAPAQEEDQPSLEERTEGTVEREGVADENMAHEPGATTA